MSVIMDNRIEIDDKENEVKKLQELVKKLEFQNEKLRCEKQNLLSKADCKDEEEDTEKWNTESQDEQFKKKEIDDEHFGKIDSVALELNLKLESCLDDQASDEETWLFDSPKSCSVNDEWLRKDVDDPLLVIVKKSLFKKLDDISSSPHHSPRHSIYSPSSSSGGILSPESPPSSKGEIDTRTFVRPRKRRPFLPERNNDSNKNFPMRTDGSDIGSRNGSCDILSHSNGSLGSEEDDRLSSASDGSFNSYRLTDVEDVNIMARLQEESLKHPEPRSLSRMSTGLQGNDKVPSSMTGAYSALSLASSGGSVTSSQEDLLTSPLGGQSKRFANTPRSSLQPPRRYYPVHCNSRENSDISTPSDSPYNSQNNLENCHGRNIGSRLPSLAYRLGNNDSSILDRQGSPKSSRTVSPLPYSDRPRNSSPRISRLQTLNTRPSRLSAPSQVSMPMSSQITEYSRDSTEVQQKPISMLPRSGSRLQPPRTRLSQSPATKPTKLSDWREGCY